MKKMFVLLGAIAAGSVVGLLSRDAAAVLKPVGDIFLNFLFVLVVPLVFFSVSTSFVNMKREGTLSKMLGRALLAFGVLWLICGGLAYLAGLVVTPLPEGFAVPSGGDLAGGGVTVPYGAAGGGAAVRSGGAAADGSAFVGALSVGDFPQLFSKYSLLPLIIFSALLGCGVAGAGGKGESFARFLSSGSEVIVKTLDVLMKAAPLGLGCYFAGTVAQLGSGLLKGYLRVFVIYCIVAAILFFVVFPLLAAIRGKSPRKYFKCIAAPSMIALASSSSSAAMPSNIEAARSLGVDRSVADSIVPLATNLLKAGTVATSVLKVMFLVLLGGSSIMGLQSAPAFIGTAILAAVVCGAVANGGVSADILICNLLGADPALLGVIMLIGTILDIPATLVNSSSTVVATVLADSKRSS